MAASDRRKQVGEKERDPLLDYFFALSVSPFVDIHFVVLVRTSVARVLEKARAQNEQVVNEVCRALAEDLLANPRPTPQVIRGFLVGDLLRAMGFRPSLIWRQKRRTWGMIKALIAGIRVSRRIAEYPLDDYLRYEFKKYADAYVALFENDYKSVESALGAISSTASSSDMTFQEAKLAFSSPDWKKRDALVQRIRSEGCELALQPHDDRHLRNALVHGSYSIEGEVLRCKDRDFQEETAILDFMGKLMRLRAINEIVACVLVRDQEMTDKLARHWDPEWWTPTTRLGQ